LFISHKNKSKKPFVFWAERTTMKIIIKEKMFIFFRFQAKNHPLFFVKVIVIIKIGGLFFLSVLVPSNLSFLTHTHALKYNTQCLMGVLLFYRILFLLSSFFIHLFRQYLYEFFSHTWTKITWFNHKNIWLLVMLIWLEPYALITNWN